jgi:hypothetical protein
MLQAQNERADFFIAAVAVNLDELLDGNRKSIFAGVVCLELFGQRFVGELAGFSIVKEASCGSRPSS